MYNQGVTGESPVLHFQSKLFSILNHPHSGSLRLCNNFWKYISTFQKLKSYRLNNQILKAIGLIISARSKYSLIQRQRQTKDKTWCSVICVTLAQIIHLYRW